VEGGCLQEAAAAKLRAFFKARRENGKRDESLD
jgi:hypothetical protein